MKEKFYKIVLENGKQLFNATFSLATAERIWNDYNGVYTVYDEIDSDFDEDFRMFIEEA